MFIYTYSLQSIAEPLTDTLSDIPIATHQRFTLVTYKGLQL